MSNEFLDTLKSEQAKRGSNPAQLSEALEILNVFCQGIGEYTANKVECTVEKGFLVNIGQEWRVKVKSSATLPYEQILFRAYIPAGGYPITLDLYDESTIECRDGKSLKKRLNDFLKRPSTFDLIQLLSH